MRERLFALRALRLGERLETDLVFSTNQYKLLDFGNGRKLERFGPVVLDRPSPAALGVSCADPAQWKAAAARFEAASEATGGCGQRGHWHPLARIPVHWTVEHSPLVFELRPTEFGHVGVFPEQAKNWDWIAAQVAGLRTQIAQQPSGERQQSIDSPRVLNLFAYTGASTLAAASAGADVVHIDASKGAVAWARRNAALSGLADAPVRWIVEDAVRFVAREQKRGNRYHGVILDPPSYGHGPKGKPWQLERDLPALLERCGELVAADAGFVLLTCHSAGVTPRTLERLMLDRIPAARASDMEAGDLFLTAADGRQLHSGVMARWAS